MKPKRAFFMVLCKLGIHSPRVWGHTNEKRVEYYYNCAWCDDDAFWDYAMPNRRSIDVDNAIKLQSFIERNPGITTTEILDRISNADHWKILEALDQLKGWKLVE
jgi:hypothetical protein